MPPPRANQVLYGGILAGNAAWRDEVIPKVPSTTAAELEGRAALRLLKPGKAPAPVTDATPLCWAVDGWACPDCGRRMSLRTVVLDGKASGRVLTGLLRARDSPAPAPHGDDPGACAGA